MQEDNNNPMLDPTKRFSSRVENYVKYRPSYPPEILDMLRVECGLTPEWRIADIGSGTGILTELFLKNGNPVLGIEPNGPMREAAERLLKGYPSFTSVAQTAEDTGLADHSVEMITAGQAFHWFDHVKAKTEFGRILTPGGWVVLIWNERRAGSPFVEAYERLMDKFAPEFHMVDRRNARAEAVEKFFTPNRCEIRYLDNHQTLDFEALKGRLLSSSYAPEKGNPLHEPMLAELVGIFERYQQDERVLFEYDTRVYFGQVS
jgi:SAM-dependent methyltransferase